MSYRDAVPTQMTNNIPTSINNPKKPTLQGQNGQGIKEWFDLDYNLNNDALKILKKYSNYLICKATVIRKPVASQIEFLIKIVSNGEFDNLKKEANIDKFFHTLILLELTPFRYIDRVKSENINTEEHQIQDGPTGNVAYAKFQLTPEVLLEKNQVINLTSDTSAGSLTSGSQSLVIINNILPIGLSQLLERVKASMGQRKFYTYDAFTNNCQDFQYQVCSVLVESNGQRKLSKLQSSFIKQPIAEALETISPRTQKITKAITNVGAWGSNLVDNVKRKIGLGKNKSSKRVKKNKN